ncbi:RlpA-like double-psi beta-barrel-protein domain-containing protein-containing protein [Immersiella caudata]|uniref:cellulase n=1 Tax=Immersiella caudata TaxID=314043 RepID=A0AA40C576_9PEZI|nr:RlpA-like double-psi beta-barrel-protein domain-containing protein-containing protein [Immersiella caudata]
MRNTLSLALVALMPFLPATQAAKGKTLTSWDCCKPACGWKSNLRESRATGQLTICGKNDRPLSNNDADRVASSCASSNAGNGFLCSAYQARPVANDLSYGFAITDGIENCCKCFELTWTDGAAVGKRIQVQVINEGGSVQEGVRQFIILTPGGGVGPNDKGCTEQWGYDWGRQYGGVVKAEDCVALPDALQAGCYWRWNWARGDVNGWNVEYNQITCPEQLSSVSGCKA